MKTAIVGTTRNRPRKTKKGASPVQLRTVSATRTPRPEPAPCGTGSGARSSTYVSARVAGDAALMQRSLAEDHRAPVLHECGVGGVGLLGRHEAHVGDEVGRRQVGLHLFGDRAV